MVGGVVVPVRHCTNVLLLLVHSSCIFACSTLLAVSMLRLLFQNGNWIFFCFLYHLSTFSALYWLHLYSVGAFLLVLHYHLYNY